MLEKILDCVKKTMKKTMLRAKKEYKVEKMF